MLVKSRQ